MRKPSSVLIGDVCICFSETLLCQNATLKKFVWLQHAVTDRHEVSDAPYRALYLRIITVLQYCNVCCDEFSM